MMRFATPPLPPPAIFPDQMAPIVRSGTNGERELVMARWGMPVRRSVLVKNEKGRRSREAFHVRIASLSSRR
jgi:putative SOS response-associated peptidase YedK